MRILIIDDNRALNFLLTKFLKREGYQVENVFDGKSALQRIHSNLYDVVITDYRLPDLTGLDVLERLKGNNIKKILISAYANSVISQKAILLGAQVLEKPFSNAVILGMMG